MIKRLMARTVTVAGILAGAGVLVLAAAGIAHSETQAVTIQACVNKTTGAPRILAPTAPKTCGPDEDLLTWNQQGPQGLPGATGATGATGPAGAQGPKGDKGAQGFPGAQGAPGISGYQIVTANSTPSAANSQDAYAICPAGKTVIGGGATPKADAGTVYVGENVAIHISRPGTLFTGQNIWYVSGVETASDATSTWHLQVYAICAFVA